MNEDEGREKEEEREGETRIFVFFITFFCSNAIELSLKVNEINN
jgi:hypothetical protein